MEPLLYEAAKIGNRVKFDLGSQIVSDINQTLLGKTYIAKLSSNNAYRLSKTAVLITDTKQKLMSIINLFRTGEIDRSKAEVELKTVLRLAHEEAYLNGMKASGFKGDTLPTKDKKWVTRSRANEHNYLRKFVDDIENKRGKMDYLDRVVLYANAVNGSYSAGRNAVMPSNMLVYWRLEKGKSPVTGEPIKHCDTCLAMSKMSPFVPENLPIVPRGGHTKCFLDPNAKVFVDRPKYKNKYQSILDLEKLNDSALKNTKVLTHKNNKKNVTQVLNKHNPTRYTGKSYLVEYEDEFGNIYTHWVVPSHKYFLNGQEVESKDLKVGDLLDGFVQECPICSKRVPLDKSYGDGYCSRSCETNSRKDELGVIISKSAKKRIKESRYKAGCLTFNTLEEKELYLKNAYHLKKSMEEKVGKEKYETLKLSHSKLMKKRFASGLNPFKEYLNNTELVSKNNRKAGVASIISQNKKQEGRRGLTKPEKIMKSILDELNIKYIINKPVSGFLPDFILEDYGIIVECDGNYWHNYPNGTKKDKIKDREFIKQGYRVIRFWESDLKENYNNCLTRLNNFINYEKVR